MKLKVSVNDLAVFGGVSEFEHRLHVGTPNIGSRKDLQRRIDDILERRWFSNDGRYVKEFEQRVAELTGVKHCIAVCNGTVALEIAIRALGLKGEVILPSFTFIATAHALQWQEITPVFCDIDPVTHNIDPRKIEQMITPRTTGIIGVHVWGRPCDIDALTTIVRRRRLKLLFDSAHAFGCSHNGKMIGGCGDAEVFSFHATKFVNCMEGGAVLTNNDELAKKMRLMKNFGFTDYDRVEYIGTNGKMNEISAAMGLTNLENMKEVIDVNRQNLLQYNKDLSGIPGVSVALYNETEKNNYQYVVVEIDDERAGLTRDHCVRILHSENILARRYFYPGCHRMEPYLSYFPNAGLVLPVTERLCSRVICLPTGTAVSCGDISRICNVIRSAVKWSKDIRTRLQDLRKPNS